MTDDAKDLVSRLHREEVERIRGQPLEPLQNALPPSFDLPDDPPLRHAFAQLERAMDQYVAQAKLTSES